LTSHKGSFQYFFVAGFENSLKSALHVNFFLVILLCPSESLFKFEFHISVVLGIHAVVKFIQHHVLDELIDHVSKLNMFLVLNIHSFEMFFVTQTFLILVKFTLQFRFIHDSLVICDSISLNRH